jgi:polygalacturonase
VPYVLKTNSNRSGIIENLFVRNIVVGQVSESVLHINCNYDIRKEGTDTLYPIVRNVFLENITSKKSRFGLSIEGIEGQNIISNIFLTNCNFQGVEKGNRIENSGEITFKNVVINEIIHNTEKP